MPITEKMRQRRRKYIGSSDLPALMGVSPFANAADVWISKTQETSEIEERAGRGSPMVVGNYSEDGTIEWVREQIGGETIYEGAAKLTKNQFRVREGTNHSANCDGLVTVDGAPVAVVEIKSSARTHEWGTPLTDEIPESVLIQVQWQMYVTNLPEAWVGAMLVTVGPDGKVYGGLTYALYRVQADKKMQELLVSVADNFWYHSVETGIMPEDLAPSLDSAERIVKLPGKVLATSPDTVEAIDEASLEYLEAGEARKVADKRVEAAKALLIAVLEDADQATTEDFSLTYGERTRKSYVVNEAVFRVLRVKRTKGGK